VDLADAKSLLDAHNQSHVLRFWDELQPADGAALLDQIACIDFDRLDALIAEHVLNPSQPEPPDDIQPAPTVPSRPESDEQAAEREAARRRGLELLAGGKVAAFVVAGGQGTRLGCEGPKGCVGVTPVTRKPLFQVFAEQILAAGARAGRPVPWYVMTSPDNDVATRAFFRRHRFFGLDADDVFFLAQGVMPVVDLDGKLLLAEPGRLAMNPDGHGGCLPALRHSGALDDMAGRGVELVSYFQVDNPLVRCLDPVFLGLHDRRGAEMSAKALPKRDPLEKVGNFCQAGGKVFVVEYSDMPEHLARQCTDDGRLRFSAGSIAIHVLSRTFVERLTADGRCRLPFHRAVKKTPYVDETGRLVRPRKPNAVKLEMFVFDALPLAERTVVLETLRDEEFSPVKNAAGEDSLITSLHDQTRRAAVWLERAGVTVPRDADGQVAAAIEISPLFADDADALAGKVDPGLEITAGQNLYLGSRGQTGGLR
jgi:UDP-N-acetylglucosamine/UDP-N-acetylgalactosamine diphosphorylase